MFAYHEFYDGSASSRGRAIGALAAIAGLCALLAFAPRHDATKIVAGAACSILSEDRIGATLGTPMRLAPTSDTVCHYVSTGSGSASALFVIARREPPELAAAAPQLRGAGDAAVRSSTGIDVRYGARWYTFVIVPDDTHGSRRLVEELRLAKLVRRGDIAQNR